jgi:FlaG/FlaF family flagellin (archaellin)
MPNLVAYDLAGVQPMSGPTGLIFAMRSRYTSQSGTEALFNEADTAFSGQDSGFNNTSGMSGVASGMGTTAQSGSNPSVLNPTASADELAYNVGQGMRTDDAENLGVSDQFNEMAFSIEKVTVTAKSRALKAEYSLELAQDIKAIHGLNAEAELANILSTEILAEINREVIRTIYKVAEQGATVNTATAGEFDLDIDSNGRWSVEKFKGLLFQIERDANAIAQRTRRGKGNIIMCSLVYSITPLHSMQTSTLMTLATPLLVLYSVSSVYTSTHILQTVLLTSITLQVIRVLHLMTQVSSTAHMYLSRWYVQLVRTPSSLRSASRPVMV